MTIGVRMDIVGGPEHMGSSGNAAMGRPVNPNFDIPPEGMLSYCTWAQDAASTKTQKENWLVSGLKDHPPPPPPTHTLMRSREGAIP